MESRYNFLKRRAKIIQNYPTKALICHLRQEYNQNSFYPMCCSNQQHSNHQIKQKQHAVCFFHMCTRNKRNTFPWWKSSHRLLGAPQSSSANFCSTSLTTNYATLVQGAHTDAWILTNRHTCLCVCWKGLISFCYEVLVQLKHKEKI